MKQRVAVRRERGYVLIILLLMVALLSFTAAVAVPRVLVQGQRDKEEEMIFRGEQYSRAIGLYYKRYGRFPSKLEELVEPKDSIRFLRQLYKNPTSRDSEWRLLRVAPDGSILGSVMLRSRLGTIAPAGGGGLLPTSGAGPTGQPQPAPQPPTAQPAPAPQPAPETPEGEPPHVPPEGGEEGPPPETQEPPPPPEPRPQPQPPSSPSPTTAPTPSGAPGFSSAQAIGSGIIGVAGKSTRRSIRVYKNGTRYMEWEFLYDPTAEARAALERGLKQGQSQQGQQPQR